MKKRRSKNNWLKGVLLGGVLVVVLILFSSFRSYLGTRAPQAPELNNSLIGGELDVSKLTAGNHTLELQAKTRDGKRVSHQVSFNMGEGNHRAVVPTSICVAAEPYELQVRGFALPTTAVGIEWREKGTSQWGHRAGSAFVSNEGGNFIATYKFDIPGSFTFGKTYEIRFFSDPANVYEFATGDKPTTFISRTAMCAQRRVEFLNLPNVAALPADVIAENLQIKMDNEKQYLLFTTNKPVFLGQMGVQYRVAGTTAWKSYYALGLSQSFYRRGSEHSIFLHDPWVSFPSGSSIEVRVTKKGGDPISSTLTFTSPGSTALTVIPPAGNELSNPFRIDRATNGFLVRWQTNQLATSKVEPRDLPALAYDDLVLFHVVPVVSNSILHRFSVTTTKPSTNEVVTIDNSRGNTGSYSTDCSFLAAEPEAFTSTVSGDACLAFVGVGPIAKTAGVPIPENMPWAVYCSGVSAIKQIDSCYLCQFPGANFAGGSCVPAPGDKSQWQTP